MYARASSVFVLALPVLAAATALQARTGGSGPSNQCDTGPIQCCETTQTASSVGGLLGFLLHSIGIDLDGITGLIGSSCSPITGVGAGGSSCSAQPVCCTNNYFGAVIGVSCTPININL